MTVHLGGRFHAISIGDNGNNFGQEYFFNSSLGDSASGWTLAAQRRFSASVDLDPYRRRVRQADPQNPPVR
jgi:hypothetical protein